MPASHRLRQLTFHPGAFLILLEMATLQTRPQDVMSPGKLRERIFGKLWLIIGPKPHDIPLMQSARPLTRP